MNTGNKDDILKYLFKDIEPEKPSDGFSSMLMNKIYSEANKKNQIAYKPLLSHKQIGLILFILIAFYILIFIFGINITDKTESGFISNYLSHYTQAFKNLTSIFNPIYALLAIVIFILLFLDSKIRIFFKIK